MATYHCFGQVVDAQSGQGIVGVRVEAWDKRHQVNDALGSDITRDLGSFRIELDQAQLHERLGNDPVLFFKVFRTDTLLVNSEGSVLWTPETQLNQIILSASAAGEPEVTYIVRGRVTHPDGNPIPALHIRALDRQLLPEGDITLGNADTDTDGRYEIAYQYAQSAGPDLVVQILDQNSEVMVNSPMISKASREETVDLVLDQEAWLRVYGIVRNEYGEPIDSVTVQAFDRDLRSEQSLGREPTTMGRYEIRYKRSQFLKAEKGNADLVLKVLNASGNEVHKTPIYYNAPDDMQININLQGVEYKGTSEFELLTATMTPLLDGLSPLTLREDDQFQDISFLSGESGRSPFLIFTWIMAHRLADKTAHEEVPLEPPLFFGFLRQGQPAAFDGSLWQDVKEPERMALLEDRIQQKLANIAPDLQRSLLEKAIADNLIPARIKARLNEILELLRQIKLRFAAEMSYGGGKSTIAQLLELTPAAKQKQAAFMAALLDFQGPIDEFWEKLIQQEVLPPDTVNEVRLTFTLGALTRNHIPLVGELANQFHSGALTATRELAKYDRVAWKALFMRPDPNGQPIGVPANIDGDTPEAKMEQYAAILEQQFERAYPTASFTGKLARAEAPPMPAKTDVIRFLDNNPEFQLDRFRPEHYVAEHADALQGIEDKAAFFTDLKSVQRVFKLNPTYKVVDALLTRKIDSAQQIYFMGQDQFVATVADTGINKLEAKRLYRKAENAYALALAMFGDYNAAINGAIPLAIPAQAPALATKKRLAPLPNLQTLFGSLDYCECAHCRSVYSPAAYFLDVMRFLGDRLTHGSEINVGKNVRQVLLERRPDLGEIELSCENTDTPLPYIDLVNEILEDVVAPPTSVTLASAIQVELVAGLIKQAVRNELIANGVAIDTDAQVYAPDSRGQWAIRDKSHAYKVYKDGAALCLLPTHQTFLSAAELRANPEYTNQNAYNKLKQEVFPLNLPFDLWYVQTSAYLNHLGAPQPHLFELFQQTAADHATRSPSDLQIDCAWLGITESERKILTGALSDKQPWDFWGLAETNNDIPNPENPADPTEHISGGWLDVLSSVNVMLHRSGLAYKELLQLLDMYFVNPTGSVYIFDTADANAANCDTSKFAIRNLTEDTLNRMHRFIRLWRKLDCTMWELDILLLNSDHTADITGKRITDAVLQEIAHMDRLRKQTGLDWRILCSLYYGIDHCVYVDRARDGVPAVQTLYERLFRNKLVDAVAHFPSSPDQMTGTIADHAPGILAAFRIKEADLTLILADLGILTTNHLDLTTLSHIHRIAVLTQALGLSIDAFLRLKRLWAQDPFANPGATRHFVDLAEQVALSNFSILELDYLLAHRFTSASGVSLEDKTIITIIQAIREGLQKIDSDIRLKTEETKDAYIKSKLGLLPALVKDADQLLALSIIDGSWQGPEAERNALIDVFFAGVLDLTLAKSKLAAILPGLTPAQKQEAVDQRFGYVQPALEAFLLQMQKEAFICQKIAEVLQLNVPSAKALLTQLHLTGDATPLLQKINDLRLLDRLPNGNYQFALTENNFPAIFQSLRLLHKDAQMISKLQMNVVELSWWLEGNHATEMGWFHPKEFPIDNATQVAITQWLATVQFFLWKKSLPKSDLTTFEFANHLLDNATPSTANIADLAQLTAWDAADINTLAAAFHWVDATTNFDIIKQELRKSANLVRLADCMRLLRRLGVNAARAIQWAKAEPESTDAESLKQTVKARYDLAQWQQVIQPLQDSFREQKRNALVSWLVAHPNQYEGQNWSDANGLYSYFLIDVEMGACMLTSRLKQAAASVQLFVQRCLLNLEADIIARTDPTDPNADAKWKQWKWMKQYRVWEANRKIFLYPENWIEPELRDEKSPFFKELEAELMQNDITNETAEQAYRNYLEKLDKVANLEIRAIYDEWLNPSESVLHVFGRSRSSQSPEYFYRTRINRGRWSAWEKVDLDINANHLMVGVHNRRLHLLWPQFLEKSIAPATVKTPTADLETSLEQPKKYWEIRLFWSELKKGKWTPKSLSDSFAHLAHELAGGDRADNVIFRTRLMPYIQVQMYSVFKPEQRAPENRAFFDKIGKQITCHLAPDYVYIISPIESRFYYNLIQHNTGSQYFYYTLVDGSDESLALGAHEYAVAIQLLRKIDPGLTFSVIDSRAAEFADNGSFFWWDPWRTYFVDHVLRTEYSYYSRAWHATSTRYFRFFIHYHPFVELFIKELNIWGLKGLLNRRIQVAPASIPGSPPPFDFANYQPNGIVTSPGPETVDFTYEGAYAPYNWELFFHAPFFIANKLSANQRFEEALEWFHYIFDPTNTDATPSTSATLIPETPAPDTPQQKFWITKPFYEKTKADYYQQKIENILLVIAKGDAELSKQVDEWRNHPFNPHLIARMRTVAYQKNVLIKYLQTLIAWGDQLFRRDTIESINEATQLYILAASVLGPRPKSVPRQVANPVMTFYQLQKEWIDPFGNALKEVENLLPANAYPNSGQGQGDEAPELPHLNVLYFGIPNNEKLLTLWDTMADRLFKIRHCMNIEGVVRQLPLFEPPIEPALLVKAAAAGLDIGAVISDMNAPLPLYRFTFMIQRAFELCNEVKALGSAMLAALEKRDAEAFAQLRSSHELAMLDKVRLVKIQQIAEALGAWESLLEAKKVVEERRNHYQKLITDGWNTYEKAAFGLSIASTTLDAAIAFGYILSGGLKLIPSFLAGAAGFGGTPTVNATMGGEHIGNSAEMATRTLQSIATALDKGAALASTVASFERRAQEWDLQKRLAQIELPQLDKQIVAADIRHQIAIQELANQDKQIENAEKEDEYLHTKFTNQELYDWMINQLSTVYFQSYQLAYDIAKRAERCFRYELGLSDSNYIQFGYWDSLKKGLLAGEKLSYDLKRLESAYYEQNRREYELTKHISLAQLDPIALLKLRQNGECFVDIPEAAFDMDYPGHYFRRIKSVGLSIPCIVGPYTSVACTLTLTSNHLRKDATLLAGKYARDFTADDPRFRDEIAAIQSIATSNAQNDHGIFDLNFRDERYLPFENAGAISSWHIKLNKDCPQFDFATISDVLIHLNFTAREGGELLKSKAVEAFNQKMNDLALAENRRGLYRVFDLKREYSDPWYRFLHPANPADDQELALADLPERLPYFTRHFDAKKVRQIEVVAQMKEDVTYKVMLSPLGDAPADLLTLAPDPTYQELYRAFTDLTDNEVNLGAWTLKLRKEDANDFKSLPADAIQELFLIINYRIE